MSPSERVHFDPAGVERAAGVLTRGGLVAFPTETVYGLGARADQPAAVQRIFAAKGRPATNPLIVHVASTAAARALAVRWPEVAERLAAAFWPGPLTLVVEARDGAVAPEVTCGGPTVAVRVPTHPAALALLRAVNIPVAAPSANRSTTVSPTSADHVSKSLGDAVDLVLDGGPIEAEDQYGIESTIIDVTTEPPTLLRYGALDRATIERVCPLRFAPSVATTREPARAPGSQALHYAPRAQVVLVEPERALDEVTERRATGARVGLIERAPGHGSAPHRELLPSDARGFGRGLYAALHRLDEAGCDVIVIARPPPGDAWDAARDRLSRAASPRD